MKIGYNIVSDALRARKVKPMTDSMKPANVERLRGHLAPDSLAAKLLDAYRDSGPADREAALKRVAETRLAEIRAALNTRGLSADAQN